MRKLIVLITVMILGIVLMMIPTHAEAGVQLSLISEDIKFYDSDGAEIVEAGLGDIVSITATIRNFGDTSSDYFDVEFHYDMLALIDTKIVMAPANDLIEVTIIWDTSEKVGDLDVEVGTHRIYVSYYPHDPNTLADDNNSGGVYSNYFQIIEGDTTDTCASVFLIGTLMLIPTVFIIRSSIVRYRSRTY